jgi:hypothetical protein
MAKLMYPHAESDEVKLKLLLLKLAGRRAQNRPKIQVTARRVDREGVGSARRHRSVQFQDFKANRQVKMPSILPRGERLKMGPELMAKTHRQKG